MSASRIAAAWLLGILFFPTGMSLTRTASSAMELRSAAEEICSTRERIEGAREQLTSSSSENVFLNPAAVFGLFSVVPALIAFFAPHLAAESSSLFQFISPSSRGPPALIGFQIS